MLKIYIKERINRNFFDFMSIIVNKVKYRDKGVLKDIGVYCILFKVVKME